MQRTAPPSSSSLLLAAAFVASALPACPAPNPGTDAAIDAPAVQDGAPPPPDAASPDAASPDAPYVPPFFDARPLPADPQRPGDPDAGYHALINRGYVSCGVPYSAFSMVFGTGSGGANLPGREGLNARLPYLFTATRTPSGVDVVAPNCLSCHASVLNGQIVVGLGNASYDFTQDTGLLARAAGGLITDETERMEWQRWSRRVLATAPYIRPRTIGVNPADNLAAVLFAHRDRTTLAWSDTPLLELPPRDPVPVDVPPWWRMRRKSAMFYNGSGRGDHARIMMTASTLCTDSVEEARAINDYFNDVAAYIRTIRPPAYPFPIDRAAAARGATVFAATCARCHGSYDGMGGGDYPNLLVSLGEVGTDPTLASGTSQFAGRFVEWFNQSFYGQTARLEPQEGYVAPPLDGIWATAPFLHNGSVPTLAALLDSSTRPRFWTRNYAMPTYDPGALGWEFTALEHGHNHPGSTIPNVQIYDTTQFGYGNGGHTFGDGLTAAQRADLLEYLKTL